MLKMIDLFILFVWFLVAGCSSVPVLPEDIDVKVSREAPDENCKNLGIVLGTTQTASGTSEQALNDLKQDAARKGANYVQIETFSAFGSAAKGTAFFCP